MCCYLKKCGAKIKILKNGKKTILIEGVEKLNPCEYDIMPDRIVAATLLCAVAATSGEVMLKSINHKYLFHILEVLAQMQCYIKIYENDNVYLKAKKAKSNWKN